MDENTDEVYNSSRQATSGIKNQSQGAYEIFRALRVVNMVIEIYVKKNIGRRYQEVRPYSNVYCNMRYVSKFIKPHSNKCHKKRYVKRYHLKHPTCKIFIGHIPQNIIKSMYDKK